MCKLEEKWTRKIRTNNRNGTIEQLEEDFGEIKKQFSKSANKWNSIVRDVDIMGKHMRKLSEAISDIEGEIKLLQKFIEKEEA